MYLVKLARLRRVVLILVVKQVKRDRVVTLKYLVVTPCRRFDDLCEKVKTYKTHRVTHLFVVDEQSNLIRVPRKGLVVHILAQGKKAIVVNMDGEVTPSVVISPPLTYLRMSD
jgi:hypothetical protein